MPGHVGTRNPSNAYNARTPFWQPLGSRVGLTAYRYRGHPTSIEAQSEVSAWLSMFLDAVFRWHTRVLRPLDLTRA